MLISTPEVHFFIYQGLSVGLAFWKAPIPLFWIYNSKQSHLILPLWILLFEAAGPATLKTSSQRLFLLGFRLQNRFSCLPFLCLSSSPFHPVPESFIPLSLALCLTTWSTVNTVSFALCFSLICLPDIHLLSLPQEGLHWLFAPYFHLLELFFFLYIWPAFNHKMNFQNPWATGSSGFILE